MKWPARPREARMKVKVVKKGTINAKPSSFCPFEIDDGGLKTPKK